MKGRPCKYGERVNGKCPPKPKTTTQTKTKKIRPCKYGERVNGKCPPKPKTTTQAKTKKIRPCKYGERVNGKCPPKPKTTTQTKTKKPCKYGERINGKCPPKPYISVFASPPASDSEDDVQVKVFMYEDGEERMFDEFSGQEMASITDYLTSMLKIDESDIYYEGDEDEEMFIGGLDMQGDRIGNGEKKYPLRQKIPVELKQYGLSEWGNVEFLFRFR